MKIVVIGVGSGALNVLTVLDGHHNFTLAGFIGTAEEVSEYRDGEYVYGKAPLLGDYSILPHLKDDDIHGFVAAIGDNNTREETFYQACQAGLTPVNIVSDGACVDISTTLGNGVSIFPGAVISPGVEIGDNTIIGSGAIVDVRSSIGENCHLMPGAVVCGRCVIERNVYLGAGAIVEPTLTVGKHQHVKSGEVVSASLEPLYRKENVDEK